MERRPPLGTSALHVYSPELPHDGTAVTREHDQGSTTALVPLLLHCHCSYHCQCHTTVARQPYANPHVLALSPTLAGWWLLPLC